MNEASWQHRWDGAGDNWTPIFFPGTDWPGILAGLRAVHGIKTSRAERHRTKRNRQHGLSIVREAIRGLQAVTGTKPHQFRPRKHDYMNGTFIAMSRYKP